MAGEDYLNAIRAELKRGRRQWKRGDKLLEAFGYTRRRQTAIDLINSQLKEKGMHTDPKLTTAMPLDRGITFYLKGKKLKSDATPADQSDEDVPVEVVELASDKDERCQFACRPSDPEPVPATCMRECRGFFLLR